MYLTDEAGLVPTYNLTLTTMLATMRLIKLNVNKKIHKQCKHQILTNCSTLPVTLVT